jgi:hypothetical protein
MFKDEILQRLRYDWVEYIERFDFDKVHSYMKINKWVWGMSPPGVPDISELKECANTLFNDLLKDLERDLANNRNYEKGEIPPMYISTGGFKVSIYTFGSIELAFTIESVEYNIWRDE